VEQPHLIAGGVRPSMSLQDEIEINEQKETERIIKHIMELRDKRRRAQKKHIESAGRGLKAGG